MKTYTREQLMEILNLHRKWIRSEDGGERANLSGADLSGANLSDADLSDGLWEYPKDKRRKTILSVRLLLNGWKNGGNRMATIEQLWKEALNSFGGTLTELIDRMKIDVSELGISDSRVHKLLRLASCPNSPIGEKTNAARFAFKYICIQVNERS